MMKKIQIRTAIFVLCALVLNGCSNIFFEKPQEGPGQETAPADIPEGFGAIRVSFFQGAARTIMPVADLDNLYLEYWFSKDGETAEQKTPVADGIFALEPGTYDLEVKAFVNSGHTNLAAQGETDTSFTVAAGTAAGAVSVTLHPVVTGTGTGGLAFGLQYPAGTTVSVLTLSRIAGSENYNLLSPAPSVTGTDPLTLNGTKTGIPVGYYLLRAVLGNSAGEYAGKTEVVHIYQNLTSQTTLADYTFTTENFSAFDVRNTNDSGPGSLRQAIADAHAVPGTTVTIRVLLPPGSVIELESQLPVIRKSIFIEGNGVTITRSSNLFRLLEISESFSWSPGGAGGPIEEVKISRVHFKDGYAPFNTDGGAIRSYGKLTLESCIFSGNIGNYRGGAIWGYGILTIRGCTFYSNQSINYEGGTINFGFTNTPDGLRGAFTLTGNLFYGNTGPAYPVVYVVTSGSGSGTGTPSASYNVVDVAIGTGSSQCGWSGGTGNVSIGTSFAALPVSPKTFRPLPGSGAKNRLPSTLLNGYPTVDFYGNPITGGGSAGAVQADTQHGTGWYYMDLSVNDSQQGSVTVSPDDADGLVSNGTIITASPNPGYSFVHWLRDGVIIRANPYTLTGTSTHTKIQAVFGIAVTLFSDEAGSDTIPGTLRYALTNAQDGDVIMLSGVTPGTTAIELESTLPDITKSLSIEGNGVILTWAASWTSSDYNTQLLRITNGSAVVTIRGVHFKNGLVMNNFGGAIFGLYGTLTVESCIFSGNQMTASSSSGGGAIFSNDTLTIRGCTFYGNSTSGDGGAVYFWGSALTMTGNLFYGNSAANGYPVVYCRTGTVTASYNVVDAAFGTGTAQTGWVAGTGDKILSQLSIVGDPFDATTFVPVTGLQNVLPTTAPTGFPTTDFYGATRNTRVPGAVNYAP
jgi:hypothetical protein